MASRSVRRAQAERHLRSDTVALRARVGLIREILSCYVMIRWLMARKDIETVLRHLREGVEDDWDDADARHLGHRLARPVRRTLGPLPWDSRCLMQSLVLVWLLSRRNVACDLVIGVSSQEDFKAHAWVERSGRALLPTNDFPRLTVL